MTRQQPEAYDVVRTRYETMYQQGYGLQHPDGHIIRIHRHILQYELGLSGGKLLDYGCGAGIHSIYFANHGFIPYGCDTSPTAIQRCQELMPEHAANFRVVPNVPRLRDYFPEAFDLLVCNQVLCYLGDADLRALIRQFHEVLKPGGIVVATLMASTNCYAQWVTGPSNGGLHPVRLDGRLQGVTHVSFKTRQEVLELFTGVGFTKIQLGFYTFLIREDEGPGDHHIFVGRK